MNILENFKSFLFVSYYWCQMSSVSPRSPDSVRISPDPYPYWFSKSRTSMEHLTPKVRNQKRRFLGLSKICIQQNFKNLPAFEVQCPGSGFQPKSDPKTAINTYRLLVKLLISRSDSCFFTAWGYDSVYVNCTAECFTILIQLYLFRCTVSLESAQNKN